MSFETYWENISEEFTESIKEELNRYVQTLPDKPSYIGEVTILGLDFGKVAPQLELLDVTDPYPEFYQFDELESGESQHWHPGSSQVPPFTCPRNCGHPDHAEENSSVTNVDHYDTTNPLTSLHHHHHHLTSSSHFVSSHSQAPTRQAWEAALDVDSDHEADFEATPFLRNSHLRRPNELHHSYPPSPPSYSPTQGLSSKHDEDIQTYLKVVYSGDFSITLTTSLNIDVPTLNFASLPIQIKVTGFHFQARAVVAYLQSKIRFSLLPDPDHPDDPLLTALHLDTTLGAPSRHTLRNVDRLETYLLHLIRQLVTKKLQFPQFLTYHLQPLN